MKQIVAISMGDPGGIGPEIILKAVSSGHLDQGVRPLVIGDAHLLAELAEAHLAPFFIHSIRSMADISCSPNALNVWDVSTPNSIYTIGKPSAVNGDEAFRCIQRAIILAMNRSVVAVTTGPISKEALHMAGHLYPGHTEIFAKLTNTHDYAMLLVSKHLKVIHATTHIALSKVGASLTIQRIIKVIELAQEAGVWFGLPKPRIAVAGLNPHCSENGLFGNEEVEIIIPAITQMREQGLLVEGPIPPDTVFVKALCGQYDFVVAMYHDQGHIPLKIDSFSMNPNNGGIRTIGGVNITVGLPIIRTSVDHGTAYDLAGLWNASAESMEDAINLAAVMAKHGGLDNSIKKAK